jgi:hypothetical protein
MTSRSRMTRRYKDEIHRRELVCDCGSDCGINSGRILILYDTIQEKNPELCGFTAEEFDKEENK